MTEFQKRQRETIKIYRTDMERMSEKLNVQREFLLEIFRFYEGLEEKADEEYGIKLKLSHKLNDALNEVMTMYERIEVLLEYQDLDFMLVNAQEWFETWRIRFGKHIGLLADEYMMPDLDDGEDMLEMVYTEHEDSEWESSFPSYEEA